VWLNPEPQNNIMVLYCLIQVYVLALVASSANLDSDTTLVPLAASTAFGGSVYLAYVVSRGTTIIGLAEEVGTVSANLVCTLLSVICVALAGSAWFLGLLAESKTKDGLSWKLSVGSWQIRQLRSLPTPTVAVREMLEVPMLLSLAIMWPPHHGRLFATILNLTLGCVVPTVAGRAVHLLSKPGNELNWWAAVMGISGTLGGSALLVPVIAQSGAVQRGLPSVVLCATMTVHALLGGYVVAVRAGLRAAIAPAE